MTRVIACPKCQKKYQLPGDPTGKSLKCAACQQVFTVGKPPAAAARPAQAPQARVAAGADPASQAGLFPDPAALPAGTDPLANHVVQDPGFAEVDLDEIRRKREAEERKFKRYEADDPLAKFNREQREARAEKEVQTKKTKTGIKVGIIGGILYIVLLVIASVVALNTETGFYILFGLLIAAAILEFIVDMSLTYHVKELDPEQYLYYALLPPYRIYYWIVHWRELMAFVILEMIVGIPLIINAFLVWHFDDRWNIGWTDF